MRVSPGVRLLLGCAAVVCFALDLAGHVVAQTNPPAPGQASVPVVQPLVPPRVHYTIDCEIDAAGRLQGTQTAAFVNNGKRPLARLTLAWSPKTDPSFEIAVNTAAGLRKIPAPVEIRASESPTRLTVIDLPRPVAPGGSVTLKARFSTSFGLDRYGRVNLLSWHPRLWFGRPAHDDFDVKVRAPEGHVLGATGALDPKTGRYSARNVRIFGLVLAKDHEVTEAHAGDVVIRAIHTKAGAQCSRLLVDTAADVIRFYRSRFGFYPQRSLTILPGGDQPMGGYPVATGIVVVHGQDKFEAKSPSFWKWITAHEIGHQYWMEHVLSAEPNGGIGWLMIGMGIYADREYCRARGITDQHKKFFDEYTDAVRKGIDTTVDLTPEQMDAVKFDFNNIVTHGKGFSIVSALEVTLGHDAFERIYKRCLREYAGRPLAAARFQAICESEAGQPLDWFFDQWVRSSRYLAYETAGQSSGRVGKDMVTVVVVKRLGSLAMPVPVVARFADGSTQTKYTDRLAASQQVTFGGPSAPVEVKIDPAGELAMVIPPPEPTADDLARRISRMDWSGDEDALAVYGAARQKPLVRGTDWFRLGLVLYGGYHYEEALVALQEATRLSAGLWEQSAIVWQGHLLDLLGRREEAVRCYRLALDKGFTGPMRHDQWNLVLDRKWVEERLATPYVRK